ncbi:hypothetical protein AB0K00_44865 [Dactylosporangium sp. NPDC049525]|uniref:VMAP-C domain-containing protein n=1 Tax=Dactylosporangium sp. NPDC049525 TaxID=3154730 RepID=UPI00343A6A9D
MAAPASTGAIVSALLEIPDIRQPGPRETYLKEVEQRLGHHMPYAQDATPMHAVWNLVDACLRYPGAVQALVEVIGYFHGGSDAFERLRAVVDHEVPPPRLSLQERRDLHAIVRGLALSGLPGLYRATVGAGAGRLSADDPVSVLGQLEELSIIGGPPKLLVFLARLAQRQDAVTAQPLYDWISGYLEARNEPASAMTAVLAAARPDSVLLTRTYLVIQLEQDGPDPGIYRLVAWLQRDNGPGETIAREARTWTFDEVPAEVDRLLTRILDDVAPGTEDLIVEFILPRELLGQPVEQWTTGGDPDDIEHPLGIDHAVVLRCLERLRNPRLRYRLRQKWGWLRWHGSAYDAAAYYWPTAGADLDRQGVMAEMMREERRVCLVLSYPGPDTAGIDAALWGGICAGTPAAVWFRDGHDPDRFHSELEGALSGRTPAELPHLALQIRREAFAQNTAEHFGNHLAVLWDDFDRMPEPYVLHTAPS